MDENRFDDWTRGLDARRSRRSVVGAITGALGALGLAAVAEGRNKKKKQCKPRCGACRRCKKGRCKPKPNGTACAGGICQGGQCAAAFCAGKDFCATGQAACQASGDLCFCNTSVTGGSACTTQASYHIKEDCNGCAEGEVCLSRAGCATVPDKVGCALPCADPL